MMIKNKKKFIFFTSLFFLLSLIIFVLIKIYALNSHSYWDLIDKNWWKKLPEYKFLDQARVNKLADSEYIFNPKKYETWERSNANSESLRYSSLDQVNKKNVANLKVAFVFHSKSFVNIEANPIYAEEKLFFPISDDELVSISAKNGELVWKKKLEPLVAKRGLVFWKKNESGESRLYLTAGEYLYSLNANTGELIDSFGYKGRLWQGLGYVAPVISDDTLISATVSYSDNFFPSINAYNVLTGKLIWNCKLISKPLSISLPFEYQIRGANPWSGMSLDSVNKILFVVTGNAQPEGNGIKRPGNNDYANSLVAINVKTGKIIWSFQEVSHDLWDKDISSPPILTTIVIGRKKIDVVVAPTKHGNTIILDRISGKPIFPWRLKKAPYSNIPGEHTAEYQPDVQSPEPFTKQIFSYDDITNIGKQNFDDIKNKIDNSNIGFFPPLEEGKEAIIFNVSGGANWPGASVDPSKGIMYTAASETTFRLSLMNKFNFFNPTLLKRTKGGIFYTTNCASCHGYFGQGSETAPMIYKFDYKNNLTSSLSNHNKVNNQPPSISKDDISNFTFFLQANNWLLKVKKIFTLNEKQYNYELRGFYKLQDYQGYPGNNPPWGWLIALNLNTGKIKWKVPYGSDEILEKKLGRKNIGTQNYGAPVATAGGLIFISGTSDQKFRVFDSDTGRELWSFKLPTYGSASPTIYPINGKQYIFLPVTGGDATLKGPVSDTYYAFTLKK